MSPSRMAEEVLFKEVEAFLDRARALSARGDVQTALALYEYPLMMVYDDHSDTIDDRDALLAHLERLAELRDASTGTIWYQEVRHVTILSRNLVSVLAEVQFADKMGHPLEPQMQTLVLRRRADGFRFACIINPILRGYWKEDIGGIA